jgi:hypothetical protein
MLDFLRTGRCPKDPRDLLLRFQRDTPWRR